MFLNLSWDTAADIQQRRQDREREEAQQKQQREEARTEESHLQEKGVAEKRHRIEKSDTETEAVGGEAVPSQSQYRKGHMSNIYLTDSDEEAIVDFVKDHEELYDKINELFKDKARKECLWEQFTNSRKLSIKVCKI